MAQRDEIEALYRASLAELAELGEVWFEYHAAGRDRTHIDTAIGEVTRESRKWERQLRKL
jgi:hypothetical protein